MINLLPRQEMRELYAGRTNSLLVRYNILLLSIAIMIVLVMVGIYFYLGMIRSNAETRISSSQSEHQALVQSEQDINDFRSDLATARQILDKRIDYSTVILRVASVVPDGVALDSLALDPSTFGTPTEMSVGANSENSILNLKNSLNNSKYFSDARINTITKNEGEAAHPYTGSLTVTFSKELLER